MSDGSELLDPFQGFVDALLVFSAMRKLRSLPTEELSVEDLEALVGYANTLNDRRLLSVANDGEIVERCAGSLTSLLDVTDETLAKLKDAPARIALQTIHVATRGFLHKYRGFCTADIDERGAPSPVLFPETHRRAETAAIFYLDLGELRSVVRQMIAALSEIAPSIQVPTLLGLDPIGRYGITPGTAATSVPRN